MTERPTGAKESVGEGVAVGRIGREDSLAKDGDVSTAGGAEKHNEPPEFSESGLSR
ncbi:hypothetical protein SAMN04487950_0017 [Halogranum rubrum]|uniref:Uncharacterized protein n=1 Tax=Halogranum rubrum TaxID=553466 RepID=A0A1I4AQQ9_9EURY|nr:hypothetical protein [Halogranum rubrum]SFK58277.1 hypothetical protein SAMN04487950_0017 [Halogranum rubrum]